MNEIKFSICNKTTLQVFFFFEKICPYLDSVDENKSDVCMKESNNFSEEKKVTGIKYLFMYFYNCFTHTQAHFPF